MPDPTTVARRPRKAIILAAGKDDSSVRPLLLERLGDQTILDQVVGNEVALGSWWFRGANIHADVAREGVRIDDFTVKLLGQSKGQSRLTARRWANDGYNGRLAIHLPIVSGPTRLPDLWRWQFGRNRGKVKGRRPHTRR